MDGYECDGLTMMVSMNRPFSLSLYSLRVGSIETRISGQYVDTTHHVGLGELLERPLDARFEHMEGIGSLDAIVNSRMSLAEIVCLPPMEPKTDGSDAEVWSDRHNGTNADGSNLSRKKKISGQQSERVIWVK